MASILDNSASSMSGCIEKEMSKNYTCLTNKIRSC